MNRNYLFVVAHPDDEILGAGATMHKLSQDGASLFVCCLSRSSITREDRIIEGMMKSHEEILVQKHFIGDFGCMKFKDEDHHEIVKFIENAITSCEADVVFTHHPADLHNDHYITSICCQEAVRLPQRQIGYNHPISEFLMFEVQSSTDWKLNPSAISFSPNTYVDVTDEGLEYKVRALDSSYIDVVRSHPHPRSEESIKALAVLRGSESGCHLAEAFQTIFKLGV